MFKRIIREPLLHFALLALLIFAAYGLIAPRSERPADNQIFISAAKTEQLATIFARTWQRPPSETELQALIADQIDEEIYVREALALGLDQDDTVIRRRLRQKMEFLRDTQVDALQPTEAELGEYLAAHPETFAVDPLISFVQVYVSPEKRGAAAVADAAGILASLQADPLQDGALLGDASLLPATLGLATQDQIDAVFGIGFGASLAQLPAGAWSGPVASAFGLHLIRVQEARPGRLPALDEVRADVLREWTNARANQIEAETLERLRSRYVVTIEPRSGAEAAP